jgi:hypothetical protein
MELHPAISSDRERERDRDRARTRAQPPEALAGDTVDLKVLHLEDDGGSVGQGVHLANSMRGPRSSSPTLASSIAAPIHALRNYFFPSIPVAAVAPAAVHHRDDDAQPPGRKRLAVDRGGGRHSPVFSGFSADDALSPAALALTGAANVLDDDTAGWVAQLPALDLPPPVRPPWAATPAAAPIFAAAAAATSPRAPGPASADAPVFAPEALIRASDPEDLLRALNETFIQTSESETRRRLELRRAQMRDRPSPSSDDVYVGGTRRGGGGSKRRLTRTWWLESVLARWMRQRRRACGGARRTPRWSGSGGTPSTSASPSLRGWSLAYSKRVRDSTRPISCAAPSSTWST